MSTPSSPKIHRPKPRRPFETHTPQQPPSPHLYPASPDETPSRTHSILNLTSSTLLGIYSPTGYQDEDEPSTPSGHGSETPLHIPSSPSLFSSRNTKIQARRMSGLPPQQKASRTSVILALVLRGVLLFGMGMGYGLLVRHLHDDRQLAPFQVEGLIKPRDSLGYLLFWGVAGVGLGSLLPWVDTLFSPGADAEVFEVKEEERDGEAGIFGADWTPVVRSVGAFVGIAYAIRKLPWSSPLQASLTLFLVNPVLWYLIDRSKPGFILSTAVGATGTALLSLTNPSIISSPSTTSPTSFPKNSTRLGGSEWEGLVKRESVEGGIWILSVLFCSCVCFGNIGRRLALSTSSARKITPSPFVSAKMKNGKIGNGSRR